MKKAIFSIFLLAIFSFGVFVLVNVRVTLADEEPSAKVCGDRIVQSPNDDGEYEKCDDGGESDRCTAECGEKMLGWAWSDIFGWLSLNPDNCLEQYLDESLPPEICVIPQWSDYDPVVVTADDEIVGWAWSDNIGWVCFGRTCGGFSPDGQESQAVLIRSADDPLKPEIAGWAKIVTLGDDGWISLSCRNYDSCSTADYRLWLNQGEFNGEQRLSLDGWAWNNSDSGFGLGWLWFNPDISVAPWVQTKYGDIYSQKGIKSDYSPPDFNATYKILSGGDIENFLSARSDIDPGLAGPVNFPTAKTRYSNVLGRLDVNSLICDFENDVCLNRYGVTVRRFADLDGLIALLLNQPLAGVIYYCDGDLKIGRSLDFKNGSGFENGAGTIIVNGDLIISDNVAYEDFSPIAPLTKFKNLASAGWIILGDLKIFPSVQELAGNFIVLGNGTAAAPNDCRPDAETAGCGQIYSCCIFNEETGGCLFVGAECEQNYLTVSGLIMARKFYLNRTAVSQEGEEIRGSEIIIYDGRLLANTPPGLGDLTKALPLWRPGIFFQ